jgi:hypothetical protein
MPYVEGPLLKEFNELSEFHELLADCIAPHQHKQLLIVLTSRRRKAFDEKSKQGDRGPPL